MKKTLTVLRNLLFIGLGIFLFWQVYKDIDLQKLITDLKEASYGWVILGLIVALSGHYARALRWRLLVNSLGHKVKKSRAFIAVMINYMANVAIPRAGEVSRPLVISKTENASFSKLIGTIIVERAFDFIILASLTVIAITIEYHKIKDLIYESLNLGESKLGQYLTVTNLVILFVLFVAAIVGLILVKKSQRAFKQHPLYIRVRGVLSGFWSGIKTIWKMKEKWQFIFLTIYIWITYFFMTYLVFFAIEATSHLGVVEGLFVLTVGSLGFILPSPGGIGTYHAAAVAALSVYAIDMVDAKLYAFIAHTSQTITLLLVGAVCYLLFLLIVRKQNKSDASIIKDKNIFAGKPEGENGSVES